MCLYLYPKEYLQYPVKNIYKNNIKHHALFYFISGNKTPDTLKFEGLAYIIFQFVGEAIIPIKPFYFPRIKKALFIMSKQRRCYNK